MIGKSMLIAAGLALGTAGAQAATWDELVNAGSQSTNWLNYGGDLAQARFWPSKAITPQNVDQPKVKWVFQTGVLGSFETSPLVENGIMYATTPHDHVFAIDVRTGKQLWHYQQKLGSVPLCCGPNNRGMAVLGDTLFMATLDAMLVAIDKKTGDKLWEQQVADPQMGYSLTMAPVIFKDKVIVGMGAAEYGIRGMITAYNAKDGKPAWGYQYVPHDVWDLDAVSPPILADVLDESGKTVPGVITGGKAGFAYVHDRQSGKPLRRSPPMVPHENLFAQPTAEGVRMLPGANGGVEWSPGAFNPMTRDVYYVNLHQPMNYVVKSEPWQQRRLWLAGAFTAIPGEEQWGNVCAVNVDTGKIDWTAKTDNPMISGALTTAGGLVFAGEGNGLFRAYDAKDGKVVWSFQGGAGMNSAPVAFEVDGKPYVAVAAGGNFQLNYKLGDAIFVFGL